MAIDTEDKRRSVFAHYGIKIFPVPDGAIAGVDRQHAWGFYRGIAAAAGISFVSHAIKFLYDAANFGPRVGHYFEAHIRAPSGTAHARLYDDTAAAVVSGSDVSTTSVSIVRLRSGAVTLTDGNEYVAQFGKLSADSADKQAAYVHSY